jgi:hypothetical protein
MYEDQMSGVWKNLPDELSEHICNQLPKVRRIPEDMKREIESQRWMLAKSYNYYLRYCEFRTGAALSMMKLRIGNGDPNVMWTQMTHDERLAFYYDDMGPGSQWARDDLEMWEMWRS